MINSLFIPYKLALLAKEKGFNEPCFMTYDNLRPTNSPSFGGDNDGSGYKIRSPWDWNKSHKVKDPFLDDVISAPLYQQLIDWFRETYKWHIYVREFVFENGTEYRWVIRNLKTNIMSIGGNLKGYSASKSENTYYETLDKALDKAFNLI